VIQAAFNAFKVPDLRRKILFTLGLIVVFRLEASIPIPGVDHQVLAKLLKNQALLQLLNLFSGGSLQNFSIVALGVYPYITASIVMQLLVGVIPSLTELQKEGEYGRNKINQYTRMLTVPLALIQGYGQMVALGNLAAQQSLGQPFKHFGLFNGSTFLPTLEILITLVAGTVFAMWLGELITENGIGNGISLIIFAGIVSRLPSELQGQIASGNVAFLIVLGIFALIVIGAIVFVSQGERRIPVQYAKRIRGGRMSQGQSTNIPLRVNSAGMIPLIFAQSIVILPTTVLSYFQSAPQSWVRGVVSFLYGSGNTGVLTPGQVWYWLAYFVLVVAFTYFYTAVTFQQQNLPDSLQKNGGFIPGHRPGRPTARYLNYVLNRITLAGAFFLATVAVMPFIINLITGSHQIATQTFSATAVLIVVGVAIDTLRQLEAQLMMRQYEGFIR
jgi:preprotein translocase subunit SecY